MDQQIKLGLITHIASRTISLLLRQNIVVKPEIAQGRPYLYPWDRGDRVALVVDPDLVKDQRKLLSAQFKHDLQTVLAGRRVAQTNSRCLVLQVAYVPTPPAQALKSVKLDLSQQKTPWHMGFGMTRNGPFWASIFDTGCIIIGGTRGMGKSYLQHSLIQSLIYGGQTELYLWDGKGGMEFARYGGNPYVHICEDDLMGSIGDIQKEVARREVIITASGVTNLSDYNKRSPEKLRPIVMVIDEIADIPKDCRAPLSELVRRKRAHGVYSIMGTTYPTAEDVGNTIKANTGTRIAFAVPTPVESRVILGINGAEDIERKEGRMLMVWKAVKMEVQGFMVDLPETAAVYLGPKLTGKDYEIAKWAIEGEGKLTIEDVSKFGFTRWIAAKLLDDWQSRGWIEKDPFASNARKITPLFRQVFANSAETPKTPKTPETEEKEA